MLALINGQIIYEWKDLLYGWTNFLLKITNNLQEYHIDMERRKRQTI